jgi:hypothetical protein
MLKTAKRPAPFLTIAPTPQVVRSWKSNGDTNVMGIDAATDNLRTHCLKKVTKETAQDMLLRGEELETPLATFRLQGLA